MFIDYLAISLVLAMTIVHLVIILKPEPTREPAPVKGNENPWIGLLIALACIVAIPVIWFIAYHLIHFIHGTAH